MMLSPGFPRIWRAVMRPAPVILLFLFLAIPQAPPAAAQDCLDDAVAGDFVFVADTINGLVVVDAGDPAHPFIVSQHRTAGGAVGLEIVGETVIFLDSKIGFWLFDVADPRSVSLIRSQGTAGA